MENANFSPEVEKFLQETFGRRFAEIRTSRDQRPFIMQKVYLALDTARDEGNALVLDRPFDALYIASASDRSATINVSVNSKEIGAIQNALPMSRKDSVRLPSTASSLALTWTAQTGKYVTLYLFLGAEFRSGSTESVNSGGVTVSEGSTLATRIRTGLTLTTLTASQLLPADPDRICETIQNHEGQTLWLGDANVTDDTGNYPGIEFTTKAVVQWRNTDALYAYNPGATISDAKIARNKES